MSATAAETLKNIAMAVTAFAGVPASDAWYVHNAVGEARAAAGGAYTPQTFNAQEYATVRRLAELIMPADDASGSGVEAGAPEFIDVIAAHNKGLGAELIDGLAWLDRATAERVPGKCFVEAPVADQNDLLEVIAFRKNITPGNAQGVAFFEWMRRLTVDAFYSSPLGFTDVGYSGNEATRPFEVSVASIGYAVNPSSFKG